MVDDEINKRVAEIEGWTKIEGEVTLPNEIGQLVTVSCAWLPPFKPSTGIDVDAIIARDSPPPYATDWAWCGPLVEKYQLTVAPSSMDAPPYGFGWEACRPRGLGKARQDVSIKRAICLAVIAAHS